MNAKEHNGNTSKLRERNIKKKTNETKRTEMKHKEMNAKEHERNTNK